MKTHTKRISKFRKILIFGLSVIMLFGVLAMTACNKDTSKDETITSLQQQIAELEKQIEAQNNAIEYFDKLTNSLLSRIRELEKANQDPNGEDGLSDDEKILQYYREPTIDDDFEDNKVNIILKSSYNYMTEIGFEDFEIVDEVSEITSIHYNLKTIMREDGVKLSLVNERNHIIRLELATHDKETVLAVIAQLKKLDMVLVAEPEYIYYIVDC